MAQRVSITVAGFPAEVSKMWTYYDTGLKPWVHLERGSYDYNLKVWGGDPGETFEHPFDGHLIKWRRVAINRAGESMEYVAEAISVPAA